MSVSVDDINTALKTATSILDQLKGDKNSSADIETEFVAIKAKIPIDAAASTVDPAVWAKLSPPDQDAVQSSLQDYIDTLRRRNRSRLTVGAWIFVVLVILLTVTGGVYLYAHSQVASAVPGTSSASSIDDAQLTKVITALNVMDDQLTAIGGLQVDKEKTADSENAKKEKFDALTKAADAFDKLLAENKLQSRLSFESLSKWAKVWSHIRGQIDMADSFKAFRKQVEPELESLRTHYFWTDIPGRWFEIAWWAEFGTLVGLLFYVAGCLQTGVFRTEEITMYLTEVLITPFVVTVVFFLFGFSGITGFNPSEASIITTVGFAFILGFAIRRTVGLLDIIKKRFLPDPSPADKTAS
jgi:hypothetical protein